MSGPRAGNTDTEANKQIKIYYTLYYFQKSASKCLLNKSLLCANNYIFLISTEMGDDCDCLCPTLPIHPPEFHKEQKQIKIPTSYPSSLNGE